MAFKVLQECSFWGSRNNAVQIIFLAPNRDIMLKIYEVKKVFALLWKHIIFNVKWDEFRKISEVFWAKLYCKMCDFFVVGLNETFCWLWWENLKLKKSDDIHWNVWANFMSKIIFSKKEFQIWDFWIIYILVQVAFFRGLL